MSQVEGGSQIQLRVKVMSTITVDVFVHFMYSRLRK